MKFADNRLSGIILSTVVMLLAAGMAPAGMRRETQSKPACPVIKLACPLEVRTNDKLKMSAELKGGDANVSPTYNWTVSAGTIESGQGTPSITINTNGLEPDATVTATVETGGYDRSCGYGSTVGSCSTNIAKKIEGRKLDEFGALKPKEEADRLDVFAIELQNDPSSQGYILSYNTSTSRLGDAQKTATRFRVYLVNKRNIESSRLVTVTGGTRQQPTVELWIVPRGAQPPKPTSKTK
jgi:hypothetical protein